MCGLSTVVTPAGASLTMYREIRSYANSIWDDNNNNNMGIVYIIVLVLYVNHLSPIPVAPVVQLVTSKPSDIGT